MCGIQHLTGLKDHLDYVLIGMRFGGFLWIGGKNKEVHGGASTEAMASRVQIFF